MGKKVTREGVISVLVAEPNVKKAAHACGISERTLHRWLKESSFIAQLAEAQREVTKGVMRKVISRTERATDTLDEIMTDKGAHAQARVTAARTLIEFAFKAVEISDIQERLDALESTQQEDDD